MRTEPWGELDMAEEVWGGEQAVGGQQKRKGGLEGKCRHFRVCAGQCRSRLVRESVDALLQCKGQEEPGDL
jgi:hypothetical protein